jgi:ferrous iron transport protein A
VIPDIALPLTRDERVVTATRRRCGLDALAQGAQAVVVNIEPSAAFGDRDGAVTRRLKELGFLPGAPVRVVAFGAFNREPIAVRVAEGTFALRRVEAAKVVVECRDD